MKIRLIMLVERDAWGQLTGVIFQEGQLGPGCFSGTPELLKIIEEWLPLERTFVASAGAAGLGSASGPAGG